MPDRPISNSRTITDALALRSARVLCAVSAVVYPLFGHLSLRQGFREDIRLRYVILAAILLAWAGSHWSEWVKKRLLACMMVILCAISAHNALLLVDNRLHPLKFVAAIVTMTASVAMASLMLTKPRHLAFYLGFANVCVLWACAVTREPLFNPAILLLAHLTLTVFVYVAGSNHIVTLQRLVASQALLEQDIERRENVEAALRESERRAQSLLEAIPDVLLRVQRDGTVLDVSNHRGHALEAAFGSMRAQKLRTLAKDSGKIRLDSALDRAFDSSDVAAASCEVQGTEQRRHAEIRAIATSQTEALVVVRDVTQEKAFEERMRTADRLMALGTLATGLAHEINNPLSYVAGNLSYAIDEVEARMGGSAELRGTVTALREARDGAERIGNIVAGLKQFTEPDADQLVPVDVNETVRSALRMMRAQLCLNTEVTLELAPVPLAHANATRLLQVVLSLVANAIQALPDRPKPHNLIKICTSQAGPTELVLEVQDNGCGIPAAQLGRIFDPFYTTRVGTLSTGLGLYLCQRFVASFGGTLSVESQEGKGARFIVVLRPALEQRAPKRLSPAPAAHEMRVLIVDDEPLVARSVARMLKDCLSTIAASGAEALSLCSQNEFDMILCDMMMPGMDGSEFFGALRDLRPDLAGRVVFMTGGAFTDQTTAFLAKHTNPWLQKPVNRDWLLDAVQQLRRDSVKLERALRVAR